jgi:hypothetical protein
MTANDAVLNAVPQSASITVPRRGQVVTGRVLEVLTVLFLVFDGAMKIVRPPSVLQASAPLGFTSDMLLHIGIVLLLCTTLYVIPRTSVLGAALLTGYLGGAVSVMFRFGMPTFEMMFPILFAVLLWISLWLRTPQLRRVFPLVRQ